MSETFKIVKLLDPVTVTNVTGGLTPRGVYAGATDYGVGDEVSYNGSSYVMYVDAPAGTLPTDTTKWSILASKGDTGATGSTGAAGVVQSVVAGTNVTVNSTDPANPIVSSSGGSSSVNVATKTSNYTLTSSNDVVLADTSGGNVTLTLPTAVGVSKLFTLKKIASANTMTIATTSAQTIDGSSSIAITAQYESITVASDNSNWDVI